MLPPLIIRPRTGSQPSSTQRGFTMALVTVALVAIIAMAALSIDVGTLYQAKAEAQRSADAAALTAARMISLSGITGDPNNTAASWPAACDGPGSLATAAATSVAQAQQNFVGGLAGNVTVGYGAGSAPNCSSLSGTSFSVNPIVVVTVKRTNLPTYFARVFSLLGSSYSGSSVSATATAEAFNPSGSGNLPSGMVPVQPRCVKPWIIPNIDPAKQPAGFVTLNGTIPIGSQGISTVNGGVIGETFNINAGCNSPGVPGNCALVPNPPTWIPTSPGVLQYAPALVSSNPGAVPACATANDFQEAIAGCDQSTVYACGTPLATQVDLTENPVNPSAAGGDTGTAVACLTNSATGADTLTPLTYPFQIRAGAGNPLVQKGIVAANDLISTSPSIVALPIYDGSLIVSGAPVTVIGFLQVFLNSVNPGNGNINVTVMNVVGCGNSATAPPVHGTSPVPVRLITP